VEKIKHWQRCEAPICAGDPNSNFPKEVIWYPGEAVCVKSPSTHWQRVQRRLNRLLRKSLLKHLWTYYTVEMLEKRQLVRLGTRGRNPNSRL